MWTSAEWQADEIEQQQRTMCCVWQYNLVQYKTHDRVMIIHEYVTYKHHTEDAHTHA